MQPDHSFKEAFAASFRPDVLLSMLAILATLVVLDLISMGFTQWAIEADSFTTDRLAIVTLGTTVFAFITSGILTYMVGRKLLSDLVGAEPASAWRFLGLYLFQLIVVSIISMIGTLLSAQAVSNIGLTLGIQTAATVVATVFVFPMFVRLLAIAAGVAEPRVFTVWALCFTRARAYLLLYAATKVLFYGAITVTSISLLDVDFDGRAIVSAALGLASVIPAAIGYMIGLATVRYLVPIGARLAAEFD